MRRQKQLQWLEIFLAVFFFISRKKVWHWRSIFLPIDTSAFIIIKTPKAKLLAELQLWVKSKPPVKIDAAVVDGMLFLRLLVDPPKTFGQTEIYLLRKLLNNFKCNQIHLVFDKVVSLSIKDSERNNSSSTREQLFTITGPDQKRPSNWLGSLRMDSLVEFLMFYWENDILFPFFENKQLFVNCKDTCFKFVVDGNCVLKTEVAESIIFNSRRSWFKNGWYGCTDFCSWNNGSVG